MIKANQLEILNSVMPDSDTLTQCMHCGLCLAVCPTYDLTKLERSSPRGRIRMIKEVASGKAEVTDTFLHEMSFCLDCQACETACPAGVKYGSMVEASRDYITQSHTDHSMKSLLKSFFLNKIVAKPNILALFSFLMAFYRKSGLQWIVRKSKLLQFLPGKLSEIEGLSPEFEFFRPKYDRIVTPENRISDSTVAFHAGCLMQHAFQDINTSTIEVLKMNNQNIFIPKEQFCCGSLHAHNGEGEAALKLAKMNIDSFLDGEHTFLISNSAGCGAYMKEYVHLFKGDAEYEEKARLFSEKVKDITEFLVTIDFEKYSKPLNADVTYHDACHLCHTQKITKEPRLVINRIPGIRYSELEDASWCCGSAGIYNIMEYDASMSFLNKKIQNIKTAGSSIVLTGNPGCIGQINAGIKARGMNIEVLHPVELIHRSYKK